MALALPYEFDTSDVWRMILKGTFGLTLLIILSLLYTLVSRARKRLSYTAESAPDPVV